MWMTDHVRAIKCAMRDQYQCKVIGGVEGDPAIEAPDGDYVLDIDGKIDVVIVKDGRFAYMVFDVANPNRTR